MSPPSRGIPASKLRRPCRRAEIPGDGEAADGPPVPQPRVVEALELAVAGHADGLHVIATGPSGTGRRSTVETWLRSRARVQPTPPDVVYVRNFHEPLRPLVHRLPAGRGRAFAEDVRTLVADARRKIAEAFESDAYRVRRQALHEDFDRERDEIMEAVVRRATAAGVAIQFTPGGVLTRPVIGGRPASPDEMESLPEDVRRRFSAAVDDLKAPVQEAFARVHDLERDAQARLAALERETAVFAVGRLFDEVRARWDAEEHDGVAAWLDELREDAIARFEALRSPPRDGDDGQEQDVPPMLQALGASEDVGERYAVNVLVTREPGSGAPVVVPTDTAFYDLFGRAEYETTFGSARTDHRHLRAGALHRAAGGYLVLDATDVLSKPGVWPRLKDVLRTREARIENLAVQYMLFPGVTLDPHPVPADVTIVMITSGRLYELLHEFDEDVARLFKLRADFQPDMPRDAQGIAGYAALLRGLAAERGWPAIDPGAIAALVEHGAQLAGDRDRLSTQVRRLTDVAAEAAGRATSENARRLRREHVRGALAARRRRADRPEQRLREVTLDGTLRVALDGRVTGQVNGLAVSQAGELAFGHPVRLTATAAPGSGTVLDIDREAELSGPIHTKGVLILAGALAERYGGDEPLSLRASIVAEQSYGPIEGDSASLAELLALLSAIGRIPLEQAIAVTGSIDQRGIVQAVGGVNEKIEGFFGLCRDAGLTGDQGVVLPRTNLRHLMLDEGVVEAVRARRFGIWAVDDVDDALGLLAGERAGRRRADGSWPAGSPNGRVAERLAAFAQAAREQDARPPTP